MRLLQVVFFISAIGIVIADTRICFNGDRLLQQYDTEHQECVNGDVVYKTTTRKPPRSSVNTTPSSCPNKGKTSTENHVTTTDPTTPVAPLNDTLHCLFGEHFDRTFRSKCCGGWNTYNPNFETCCMRDAKNAVVHKNKPEKTHVCCPEYGNYDDDDDIKKVYERGSREMPCLHPSLNDKFWQKPRKLKKMAKFCHNYRYAYIIQIGDMINITRTTPVKCYNATLKRWSLVSSSKSDQKQTYSKCIPIDKYSPKRKLSKNVFAVLTNHDYQNDLDFYLDPKTSEKQAMVFKGPRKMRRFRKRFRKSLRKCQKKNSKTPNKTS